MVTPLDSPETLDHAGLERLIEHLIAGGVSGLFILGTTGEGPALSYRLRRELVSRTSFAGGRSKFQFLSVLPTPPMRRAAL